MNVLEQLQRITAFIFDVDGVLTDGSVLLLENGLQARRMNIKDGLALQMALKHGYKVFIISGGASEPVINRLQYLGVDEIHLGVKDKMKLVISLMEQHQLLWDEILFMGDDLPDLPVMEKAGVAACPADAAIEIKERAHYVSVYNGGAGCVRDVIEKVLKLNGHWNYSPEISSR